MSSVTNAYVNSFGDINLRAPDQMDPRGFNDVVIAFAGEMDSDSTALSLAGRINQLIDQGVIEVNMLARYRTS